MPIPPPFPDRPEAAQTIRHHLAMYARRWGVVLGEGTSTRGVEELVTMKHSEHRRPHAIEAAQQTLSPCPWRLAVERVLD
jgi:hypothetical protein